MLNYFSCHPINRFAAKSLSKLPLSQHFMNNKQPYLLYTLFYKSLYITIQVVLQTISFSIFT